MFLSIWDAGLLTPVIIILFVVGEVGFISQAFKHSKVEGYSPLKSSFVWFAVGLLAAFIIALLTIASEYR